MSTLVKKSCVYFGYYDKHLYSALSYIDGKNIQELLLLLLLNIGIQRIFVEFCHRREKS